MSYTDDTDTLVARARDLYQRMHQAELALRRAELPLLRVTTVTEDGEKVPVLSCPSCGCLIDDPDLLISVDVAERWTRAAGIEHDDEGGSVSFHYDDPGHFDGVTLLVDCCSLPVSLPGGWEEQP